jgi:hypothetical protein
MHRLQCRRPPAARPCRGASSSCGPRCAPCSTCLLRDAEGITHYTSVCPGLLLYAPLEVFPPCWPFLVLCIGPPIRAAACKDGFFKKGFGLSNSCLLRACMRSARLPGPLFRTEPDAPQGCSTPLCPSPHAPHRLLPAPWHTWALSCKRGWWPAPPLQVLPLPTQCYCGAVPLQMRTATLPHDLAISSARLPALLGWIIFDTLLGLPLWLSLATSPRQTGLGLG